MYKFLLLDVALRPVEKTFILLLNPVFWVVAALAIIIAVVIVKKLKKQPPADTPSAAGPEAEDEPDDHV